MNLKRGHILGLGAGIVWGTVGGCMRVLYDAGFTPLQISMYRTAAMGLTVAIIILFHDRRLFYIRKRDLKYAIPMGLFGTALGYITYSNAMKYTTLAIASMLTYTNPIYTTLLAALFLKERIYKGKVIGLILLITGCALLVKIYDGSFFSLNAFGILNGVLTGFFVAVSALCAKKVTEDYHPITGVFYNFAMGTVFLFIFAYPWEINTSLLGTKELLSFAYTVLFPGVLGFFLYMYSVKEIEVSQAEFCVSVEPVVAGIIGFAFFNETFAPAQFVGAAIILLGVFVFNDAWGLEKTKATEGYHGNKSDGDGDVKMFHG